MRAWRMYAGPAALRRISQDGLRSMDIGAWRMATACPDNNAAAFEQLERDYIRQDYALAPGQTRPTPDMVSELFGQNLRAFYGPRAAQVLAHPRYRLHVVTSRGRHLLSREHGLRTPLGYLGAFLTNSVQRKATGAWPERVVFSSAGAYWDGAITDYHLHLNFVRASVQLADEFAQWLHAPDMRQIDPL